MPHLFKTGKSCREFCIPLTFSYLSEDLYIDTYYQTNNHLIMSTHIQPTRTLTQSYTRLPPLQVRQPLMEIPRSAKFSTLHLTWISALVKEPYIMEPIGTVSLKAITPVLLTKPFLQTWRFIRHRIKTFLLRKYPSLFWLFVKPIPQRHGIDVYH